MVPRRERDSSEWAHSALSPLEVRDCRLADAPPEVLAERFAKAVAARTDELRIIRPDNTSYLTSWSNTGVPVTPYAVHLGDVSGFRTLALDFDGVTAGRDALAAVLLLRHAGVRAVLTRSGPRSGRHVLATLADPVPPAAMSRMARAFRRRFASLDDSALHNPMAGMIRPPLSPHRLGGRSEPVGDLLDVLAVLEARNPPDAWRRLADALCVPLLTPRMERLLRYGDEADRYRSRSEVAMAMALAHANAGSTEEHLLHDFLAPSNIAGDKIRGIPDRDARGYVHRCWLRACERVRRSPMIGSRCDALARLDEIRRAVEAASWPGRTGATDYAIMQAHLAIAGRVGGPEYHASIREVAERAGVHLRTVIRRHKHLIATGWLRRRGLRYPGQATRWHLRANVAGVTNIIPLGGRKDV